MLAPTLIWCRPLVQVKLSVKEIVLLTMYPTQSGVAMLGTPCMMHSARPCVPESPRFPLGIPRLLFQFSDWLARPVLTFERLKSGRNSLVVVVPKVRRSDTLIFCVTA